MVETVYNEKLASLFGGEFEFIRDGFNRGDYNMRADEERAKAVAENRAKPAFRIYGWKPWCVSLGRHQKEDSIDRERLEANGFDITRRPTGGRAVLHADELTYSVVLKLPAAFSAADVYRAVHIILLKAMRLIGIEEAEFQKSKVNLGEFYKKEPEMSVSCFASAARYEIEWRGKKIVGSAQRLYGDVLLQHGSIPLGRGFERLADAAKADSEAKRKALKEYILSKSACLSEARGSKVEFDEFALAIEKVLKGII